MRTHPNPTVTEHELGELRTLIEERSGIVFEGSRERFFVARVQDHAQAKGMARGAELVRLLRSSNVEYESLLEHLLTQETSFFRYPDVYGALERHVLPELHMKKFWEDPRSLRLWSAGCASGEEPYSIAITIADALASADAWNIHILATDVSRQALAVAERGVYPQRELDALNARQLETYFTRAGNDYRVKPRIRQMVSFAPMNLAQAVYPGRFDCIFCMNVLIYFSAERRAALIKRFHDYLEPGGYLFLGHAETVAGAGVKFKTIIHGDARVYQRLETSAARASVAQGSGRGTA